MTGGHSLPPGLRFPVVRRALHVCPSPEGGGGVTPVPRPIARLPPSRPLGPAGAAGQPPDALKKKAPQSLSHTTSLARQWRLSGWCFTSRPERRWLRGASSTSGGTRYVPAPFWSSCLCCSRARSLYRPPGMVFYFTPRGPRHLRRAGQGKGKNPGPVWAAPHVCSLSLSLPPPWRDVE